MKQLRNGQQWKTRGGSLVTLTYVPTTRWFVTEEDFVYSNENGEENATRVFSDYEHRSDLVELVKDAPATLKAGQVWRTRKGELTTLSSVGSDGLTFKDSLGGWLFGNNSEGEGDLQAFINPSTEDLVELVQDA